MSFEQLLAERVHLWRTGGHEPLREHSPKLAARAVVERLGIRTPELYAVHEAADFPQPPQRRFVVKPANMYSAQGVWLCEEGPKGFTARSHFAQREVREWSRVLENLARFPGRYLVEEHLGFADDWKAYCFPQVEAIRQVRRGRPRRVKWWSATGEPLGCIERPGRVLVDPSLPAPRHPEELARVAETIARALGSPFVRIDLYDTERGVVFGEITPCPGEPLFVDEWDRRLGAAWRRSM